MHLGGGGGGGGGVLRGPLENMQIDGVAIMCQQSEVELREILGENLADIHLSPLIAGPVGGHEIINGIYCHRA